MSQTQEQPEQRQWALDGIGSTWQNRFFYWLIRLGGKNRGYHMAHVVSLWYVLFYPSIRRRCRFYLNRRFPHRRGKVGQFLDTYRLVRSYGSTLVDMMILSAIGRRGLTATCPDHDRLLQLCAEGRGFVLVHAHVGCWQVGMSTLGQFPRRVSIVMIPEARTAGLFDPTTAGVIDPRGGLSGVIEMTESLLRGEIVTMMGDRTFGSGQNAVPARLLGGEVMLPVTPYRLASATGMPVVVMTAPKISRGSYELRLARLIDVPPGVGRKASDYQRFAQQFADCVEEFARDYPWQFFNFYDFWGDEKDPHLPQG